MGLKDDWREQVLNLHARGLNRRQITEQVPISSAYISHIVAEAGRTFASRGQTEHATRGRIAKRARVRIAEAERLLPLAEQAFAQGDLEAGNALADKVLDLVGLRQTEVLLHDARWLARATGQA